MNLSVLTNRQNLSVLGLSVHVSRTLAYLSQNLSVNLSVLTKPTKFVSCRFVGSCKLNPCLIKSKFVSEFVGTDKPTKFVGCRFVGSCQLNSCLCKSKFVSEFVGTDKPTKICRLSVCRFMSVEPLLNCASQMLWVNLSVLTNQQKFCIRWPKWVFAKVDNRLKVTSFGDPQHQETT